MKTLLHFATVSILVAVTTPVQAQVTRTTLKQALCDRDWNTAIALVEARNAATYQPEINTQLQLYRYDLKRFALGSAKPSVKDLTAFGCAPAQIRQASQSERVDTSAGASLFKRTNGTLGISPPKQ
jgi:hypothetical protein